MAEIQNTPSKRVRALKMAILLEQGLRTLPIPHGGHLRVPIGEAALNNFVAAHEPRFSRGRALKGVVWVRDDIAHGLGNSGERDWDNAIAEFGLALEEIRENCDPRWRAKVWGDGQPERASGRASSSPRETADKPTAEDCELLQEHQEYRLFRDGMWRTFLKETAGLGLAEDRRRDEFAAICHEFLQDDITLLLNRGNMTDWRQFVTERQSTITNKQIISDQ
jgi:hypothetical protein